jgi:DNA-binding transcriptional ArsR family regulator
VTNNTAGQPPGHGALDRRILAVLGGFGQGRAWPTMRTIAHRVGVSPRHVRRRLAVLEAAGLVERVPVFERTDDAEWQRRGGRPNYPGRQTSNTYRLPCPGAPDMASSNHAGQPPGHADSMSALESEGGADGGYQGTTDEDELALTPPELIEVAVEPPASVLLDHRPDVGEVLDVLGRAFGEVLVLEGPATYLTARGRLIDLATCSADDLDLAVEQLQRHTCSHHSGPCQAGHRCLRHSRRRREP